MIMCVLSKGDSSLSVSLSSSLRADFTVLQFLIRVFILSRCSQLDFTSNSLYNALITVFARDLVKLSPNCLRSPGVH